MPVTVPKTLVRNSHGSPPALDGGRKAVVRLCGAVAINEVRKRNTIFASEGLGAARVHLGQFVFAEIVARICAAMFVVCPLLGFLFLVGRLIPPVGMAHLRVE